MGPPELRRYLRSVARQLRELGPLERRTVLREVRADVLELASRDRTQSPSDEEVLAALRSMSEPSEVADSYLETSAPSTTTSRLAFGVRFLQCKAQESPCFWFATSHNLLRRPRCRKLFPE